MTRFRMGGYRRATATKIAERTTATTVATSRAHQSHGAPSPTVSGQEKKEDSRAHRVHASLDRRRHASGHVHTNEHAAGAIRSQLG